MKKTKFLALVLVAAVVLMGAGYAAWTDTFRVDNTIETGELSVVLEETEGFCRVLDVFKNRERGSDPNWDNIIVADPEINSETKAAIFKFENLFPGTTAVSWVRAWNNGTIPAVIKEVKVDIVAEGEADIVLKNAMDVNYTLKIKDAQLNDVRVYQGVNCKLVNLQAELNEQLKGEVLLPDYRLTIGDDETEGIANQFRFNIPVDALEGDEGENGKVQVTIDFDFGQHNVVPNKLGLPAR